MPGISRPKESPAEIRPRRAVAAVSIAVTALAVAVLSAVVAGQMGESDAVPVPTPAVSRPSDGPEGFPNAATSGVPQGTKLLPYYGPCSISQPGTRIANKVIGCDRLAIKAADVTIIGSTTKLIDVDTPGASVTIEDSDIDGGRSQAPAVGYSSVTLRRVDVRGGQTSVLCSIDCVIEDSWLHDQMPPVGDAHLNGFLSSGGHDVVVRRNTIECTPPDNAVGGGCTGAAQIFADFAPLRDYRFEDNLFVATRGGYCGSFGYNPDKKFGKQTAGIVVVGNTFQRGRSGKCGIWGAGTSFDADGQGNRWSGNVWDAGGAVEAR